jgi:hypothetical protein
MRIYRVGLVGHTRSRFQTEEQRRAGLRTTILALVDQYEPNRVCFNINGFPGIGLMAGLVCKEFDADCHLFLPCPAANFMRSTNLADEKAYVFEDILNSCFGLTQIGQEFASTTVCEASQSLVDNSDFIVSFWEGQKTGLTFETIKYAVANSKMVLDGLRNLSMITKEQLGRSSDENL